MPNGREEEFNVVKVFTDHGTRGGPREIRGKAFKVNGNGKQTNGDISMNGNDDSDSESEDSMELESPPQVGDKPATVVALAISSDGKWLGSADLERKVCVFNLESLSVSFLDFNNASLILIKSFLALHYPSNTLTRSKFTHFPSFYFRTNSSYRATEQFPFPVRSNFTTISTLVKITQYYRCKYNDGH